MDIFSAFFLCSRAHTLYSLFQLISYCKLPNKPEELICLQFFTIFRWLANWLAAYGLPKRIFDSSIATAGPARGFSRRCGQTAVPERGRAAKGSCCIVIPAGQPLIRERTSIMHGNWSSNSNTHRALESQMRMFFLFALSFAVVVAHEVGRPSHS